LRYNIRNAIPENPRILIGKSDKWRVEGHVRHNIGYSIPENSMVPIGESRKWMVLGLM